MNYEAWLLFGPGIVSQEQEAPFGKLMGHFLLQVECCIFVEMNCVGLEEEQYLHIVGWVTN